MWACIDLARPESKVFLALHPSSNELTVQHNMWIDCHLANDFRGRALSQAHSRSQSIENIGGLNQQLPKAPGLCVDELILHFIRSIVEYSQSTALMVTPRTPAFEEPMKPWINIRNFIYILKLGPSAPTWDILRSACESLNIPTGCELLHLNYVMSTLSLANLPFRYTKAFTHVIRRVLDVTAYVK